MDPALAVGQPLFLDRRHAGRLLASRLIDFANQPDSIVLGLPRGGIPVAAEVARALEAPLDALLVRKLGVPGHEELAMGAIASGGLRVLNREVIADLGIPQAMVGRVEAAERQELDRRERVYRGDRPPPVLQDRVVVVVDDGLATGSTMRAAVEAVRRQHPARIVAAAPVGAAGVRDMLADVADEVVIFATPSPFGAVGLWYEEFPRLMTLKSEQFLPRRNSTILTKVPLPQSSRRQRTATPMGCPRSPFTTSWSRHAKASRPQLVPARSASIDPHDRPKCWHKRMRR